LSDSRHRAGAAGILQSALDRAPGERARYLDEACAGDAALRAEVERRLDQAQREVDDLPSVGTMTGPVRHATGSERSGQRLYAVGESVEQYEILGRLGRGGMGEVYRAKDRKLGRQVAIKILGADSSAASFLERFRREAKVLAALNHPNVAAIYDLVLVQDRPHLVLELVEGETLEQRLSRGAPSVEEVVAISMQVAQALAEAHRKGIVHRDLKPANVKIDAQGVVKVLDFGLAKSQPEATDAPTGDAPDDQDSFRTEIGVLLGTASYMSPEQARGEPVDKRTDIWAFGCVLYEMLSGRKAFRAKGAPETLASVLRDEVDWTALPPATPAGLRRLLRRCLHKDRRRRLQDMGDVQIELDEALSEERPEASPRGNTTPSRGFVVVVALAGLVATTLVGWLTGRAPRARPGVLVRALVPLAPAPSPAGRDHVVAALSPDGTQLVYTASSAGVERLYSRPMSGREAVPLTGTEGARGPFFSPDGRWIAFAAGGQLVKVPAKGGTPAPLCAAEAYRGGSWGADEQIVFADRAGLWRVAAAGGARQALTSLGPAQGVEHVDPLVLPGTQVVLFTVWTGSLDSAWIVALDRRTGEQRRWFRGLTPRLVAPSRLVFARSGSLWMARLADDGARVMGDPVAIPEDVQISWGGTAQFAVAGDGTLVYFPRGIGKRRRLVLVDRQGEARDLLLDQRDFAWPRWSPDGRRLAVHAEGDIWVYDVERSVRSRLTHTGDNIIPTWTRDGRKIAFASGRGGPYSLYWKGIDQTTEPSLLWEDGHRQYPGSWSPHDRQLAFYELRPSTARDILLLAPGGEPVPFLATEFEERAPAFSPDGRWLAYVSDETGRDEIHVQPYPPTGEKWTLSSAGGTEPIWPNQGGELLYRHQRAVFSVRVAAGGPVPFERPRKLFDGEYELDPGRGMGIPNFDATPDGRHLVMVESARGDAASGVQLVLNWRDQAGAAQP